MYPYDLLLTREEESIMKVLRLARNSLRNEAGYSDVLRH